MPRRITITAFALLAALPPAAPAQPPDSFAGRVPYRPYDLAFANYGFGLRDTSGKLTLIILPVQTQKIVVTLDDLVLDFQTVLQVAVTDSQSRVEGDYYITSYAGVDQDGMSVVIELHDALDDSFHFAYIWVGNIFWSGYLREVRGSG